MRFSFFALAALAFALGTAASPIESSDALAKRCIGGRDNFASVEEFMAR
jgi:hypothetical protein